MYSKEKQQKHIGQIRRILVIKPDSTIKVGKINKNNHVIN